MYGFGSGQGEWVTGLGLGLTNSGGTWGKMGYVSVFWLWWCGWYWGGGSGWVASTTQGLGGLGGGSYESGLSVLMAGPGICILC